MKLANGLWEHADFNNRLQASQAGLGTSPTNSSLWGLAYGYGQADSNNGNLRTQAITGPGLSLSQSYEYDEANRLQQASEGGSWAQTYVYDAFGNRAVLAGSYVPATALTPQTPNTSTVPYQNNRWTGAGYDASGNQTAVAGRSFAYDAEGRITSATIQGGATATYLYDGLGRRVQKVVNGVTTTYVYNVFGKLIAEYGGSASGLAAMNYVTVDHLGSTRVVMNDLAEVTARYDYLPFGEELPAGMAGRTTDLKYGPTADAASQKFTGQQRETETGLDYFRARYMSPAQGRFTSVDPGNAGAYESAPQSWNGYAYVENLPLTYIDPSGMFILTPGDDSGYSGVYTAEYVRLLLRMHQHLLRYQQQVLTNVAQTALEWLSQPRDPGCVAAATARGAAFGMSGGGTVALVGGPAAPVTVPVGSGLGALGGGAIGGIGGLISCMSSTVQGGGSGAPSAGTQPTQGQFWKGLKPFRGKTKTNGLKGKNRRYYERDHTHGDIEVYDARGRHLGSANPETGAMTKPAVPGRTIII